MDVKELLTQADHYDDQARVAAEQVAKWTENLHRSHGAAAAMRKLAADTQAAKTPAAPAEVPAEPAAYGAEAN